MELIGKTILITRPRNQSGEFARQIIESGAEPVYFPVIHIQPMEDTTILDRALHKLSCYDWLILTSINGVEMVWARLEALGINGLPPGLRVAAIGPKTAAGLEVHGIHPQFVPDEYIAEAILPGLGDIRGRWILLPRAEIARRVLPDMINAAGGFAHEIAAYRTQPDTPDPAGLERLQNGVDVITFTSSSTVRNFVALARAANLNPASLPGQPIIACIGPITAQTIRDENMPVDVIAEEYTIEGLLRSLQAYTSPVSHPDPAS
jgi:uroporphyrinogen-III synthase